MFLKKCLILHQSVFLSLKLIVDKVLSCSYHNQGISVLGLYHLNIIMDIIYGVRYSTQAFQKELGSYQRSVDAATASGNHLVAEVLDDPTVTQQDLGEMNEMWEEVCVKSVQKHERLNEAQEVCNFIVLLLHNYQ